MERRLKVCLLLLLSLTAQTTLSLEEYVQYYETALARPTVLGTSAQHITALVQFTAHGREFRLHLSTNQHLFTSGFNLRVHEKGGSVNVKNIDTRHIVIGHVVGEKNSLAHGKVSGEHFEGVIHTEGETYHVEPIERHFKPTAGSGHNVLVYRASDVNFTHPSTCGLTSRLQRIQESGAAYSQRHYSTNSRRLRKRQEDDSSNTCTIHVWADHEFYKNIGNNDEAITLDAMALHITESDTIYRGTTFNDELTNIGVAITAADIITVDNPSDNPFFGDFEVDELLQAFATEDFNSVCLGHLFTYRDFSGTVGLAYVADPTGSLAGGICQERTQTFGGELNLNTGLTTLLTFGRRLPQGVSIITTAHEIGHNFGSEHDPPDSSTCAPGGSAGNFIMFATATDGTLPNNRQFSSCSRDVMGRTIVNNGNCFVAKPSGQVCGNGIVEGTEECDCGSDNDTCPIIDPCCKPGECLLQEFAECSPQKYTCCNVSCTILPAGESCSKGDECLEGSSCNGFNESCPQPFRDNSSFCNDGNNICVDGVCSGSVCIHYNATQCFCTDEEQLCDVCCQFEVDGLCESTKNRQGVVNATIQSGFPCKNFNGYCDDNGECITVDTNIPLDDLRNLIPSFSSIVEWLKSNWYWVVTGVVITIIVIILLQVTYRRKKKKDTVNEQTTNEASEHIRLLEERRRQQQRYPEEASRL